jgi:hypothetical protein
MTARTTARHAPGPAGRQVRSDRGAGGRAAARPPRRQVLAVAAGVLVAGALLAGCGVAAPSEAVPLASPSASRQPASASIELTRSAVEAALKSRELGLIVPQEPFRPPESTALIDAPRAVYQVVLPDDPTGGYLVIYDFPNPDAAHAAGVAQAAWLASGPGTVNFPPGTTHVIRQVGTTLVTFSYPPQEAPDSRAAAAAEALDAVGQGIPVPA